MDKYVTLKEIANRIGLDRSNARKWLIAQGYEFARVRDNESRQMVNALSIEDAERAIEERQRLGFDFANSAPALNKVDDGSGILYLIRLMPDIAPNRIKIGFATSLNSRLQSHRCTCPQLEVVKTWDCHRTFELAAMAAATNGGARLYGGEVYDVESVADVVTKLDAFFSLVTA